MLRAEPYAGRYKRPRSLPPRCTYLVEAVAAIHRPAHGWCKWHLGGLAAFGADHFVELLGATGAPHIAVDRPAVGTARRLVLESFGGVELLLPNGKNVVEPAITARQSLVAEAHGGSPFFLTLDLRDFAGVIRLAFDPFPGRDYSNVWR